MKVEQVLSLFGALAVGAILSFLVFGLNKKETIIREPNIVYVPNDTCIGVSVDSMEIYRIVKEGITQKEVKPVLVEKKKKKHIPEEPAVEVAINCDSIDEQVFELNDSLFYLKLNVQAVGDIIGVQIDYRLDTLEIMRKFTVVDTVLKFIEPIIIEKQVETVKTEFISARSIGVSLRAGTFYNPLFNDFYLEGGLYYNNRRMFRYELNFGTNQSFDLGLALPLWREKNK